jgi:predicted RNA-binding Zn ribbon-like protein
MAHGRAIAMIGGHLALDFANTAGWHASEDRIEHLPDYEEVAAWARRAGVVSARAASRLRRHAARRPRQAARALRHARALRELLYRIFTAIARQRRPSGEDLIQLHAEQAAALRQGTPHWGGAGVEIRWSDDPPDLERPLYPIALAAGALVASPPPGRLRQCGNHPCGWLFIDTSRNGTRRWCSSEECGNISRVRRFRARRAPQRHRSRGAP